MSPRRNRIDPWSDIHAASGRGLFTGNRGCLVDDRGTVVRHHGSPLWIACVTEFRDWRHPLAAPHRWTPIFFLDDAVALAAGHRPCAFCRREDYRSYRDAVSMSVASLKPLLASELDRRLVSERHRRGRGLDRAADRLVWEASVDDLPVGTVVVDGDRRARLLLDDRMLAFTFDGWTEPIDRPTKGTVQVLTPPTSVAALANGFTPVLHRPTDSFGHRFPLPVADSGDQGNDAAAMATSRRADMFTADGKPSDDDPRENGPTLGDERTTLVETLRTVRLTLEMKCSGLDAEAMARRSVEPSTMSLLGLVRHLAEIERGSFRGTMAGQDVPRLYCSDNDRDGDFDGAVPDPQVVAEAWEAWRAEVDFAERFVAEAPSLDITANDPLNEHGSGGGAISLREMLVGMIHEYARHLGHADLLRERIDGRIGQ